MRVCVSPALGGVLREGREPQFGGTLVCTMPGRWSRMCSSVAAMSISFTPVAEGEKSARKEEPQAKHMALQLPRTGGKQCCPAPTFGHSV